jgi:hypothetical protein
MRLRVHNPLSTSSFALTIVSRFPCRLRGDCEDSESERERDVSIDCFNQHGSAIDKKTLLL